MKKTISVLLTILMIISIVPFAFAESVGIETLKINPYGNAEDSIDTVTWFSSSGKYFLFLPADTDLSSAKIYFSASGSVTLDGNAVESGESAEAFTAGGHTLACGGTTYQLIVFCSANLPAVYLTTESGSLSYIHADKENKEKGNIRIYEDGSRVLNSELKQIKGRGNATWGYPKKPYNIKFDKKTSILGMPKAKKWTLLANYRDLSMIHNVYGWELASAFGLNYTSEYRYVDLYINGEYKGNYAICESVEIGDNRVEINDLEKANENANPDIDIESLPQVGSGANGKVLSYSHKGSRKWIDIPNEPADVTGGYLLEYEYGGRYNPELSGFVTSNGQPIVIKSPECASHGEVNYIADFVDAGTRALYSETGFNEEGKHFSEYFDVESLVNMYILQEMSMNYDAAFSSFFAYKAEGNSKVVFGPIWDMDNAFGSSQTNMNVPLITTNLWWANQMAYHGIPTVLAAADRHSSFRAAVREKWASLIEDGAFENVEAKIDSLVSSMRESAAMNDLRWNHFSTTNSETSANKWQSNVGISRNFVSGRKAELSKGFGADGAYLYFDMNGQTGGSWASVSPVSRVGDTVTVRSITGNGSVTAPSGKVFYSWNTERDGSGTRYLPGDSLTLTKEETVLYAIWKSQAEIDEIKAAEELAAAIRAFDEAKTAAKAAADGKAKPGDSAECAALINAAKAEIDSLSFDEAKTLEENSAEIDAILSELDSLLFAQRKADKEKEENENERPEGYCHWCGKVHGRGFVDFIKKLFHNLFADLFGRKY